MTVPSATVAMRSPAIRTMRAIAPGSTQANRFKARMTAGREIGNHIAQQIVFETGGV